MLVRKYNKPAWWAQTNHHFITKREVQFGVQETTTLCTTHIILANIMLL